MARPIIPHRSGSKQEYEKFCQLHPKTKITFKQYKDIIYLWNRNFMTYILETGDRIKVPFGFGTMSINKKKSIRYFEKFSTGDRYCILPVDWKRTRLEGKKIYYLNNHTDGYRFKWFWFKTDAKIKFSEIWSFKPTRENSLLLFKYLTKKDKVYQDVYNEWYKGRK